MNHTKVTLLPTCLTRMLTAMGTSSCGKPLARTDALRKIQIGIREVPMPSPATSHMFIVNPLSANTLRGIFASHLPTEERIARLQAITLKC
jgi:heat shock protein HtpX